MCIVWVVIKMAVATETEKASLFFDYMHNRYSTEIDFRIACFNYGETIKSILTK